MRKQLFCLHLSSDTRNDPPSDDTCSFCCNAFFAFCLRQPAEKDKPFPASSHTSAHLWNCLCRMKRTESESDKKWRVTSCTRMQGRRKRYQFGILNMCNDRAKSLKDSHHNRQISYTVVVYRLTEGGREGGGKFLASVAVPSAAPAMAFKWNYFSV
jgi:hypothetical protein